ncbi:3-oxoacyl-[acyl-carrier-protein] reductase FabG [Oligella ureolytica]|uniref:3-oxoacyl-[acyl-carrier-protein] reductase FabG n=1 Tax=Oligella ureolytica TaxID=90244 RepID=A0A378X9H0_9BURK|nr:acetoacetyl-CoA reductase [Oligella ureolytica]QPT40083.1 acetoacetyl-CoA reductase [Oligella ureolytica]SUA50127.1 3-oxoacyl-[acyl-carrier-protein] reductase FabG [Oligella ureolytica]
MIPDNERTALITGGIGGLGTAIARSLANRGHQVLVTYYVADNPDEWLAEQKELGYDFKAYPVDVADFASCQKMIKQIHDDGFKVDMLINNAGITKDRSFRKMSQEEWDDVLRTNLDSVFNVTKQVIEDMLESGWGRIVTISSVNGSKGQFGQANYSSAKSGMYGFSKSLALEFASKGITVNTISPGYIKTEMVAAMPQEILEEQIIPQIPVGRLGKPEEIGELVAYLCSESAAYITGANIAINGGLHMY